MKGIFQTLPCTNQQKVEFTAHGLRGPAWDWWQRIQVNKTLQEWTQLDDPVGPPRHLPICGYCGRQGHLERECRSRRLQKKCYNCGDPGHLNYNCPKPKGTRYRHPDHLQRMLGSYPCMYHPGHLPCQCCDRQDCKDINQSGVMKARCIR
jgi:hypothetical protein